MSSSRRGSSRSDDGEASTGNASTVSASEKGKSRYKPLAPKQPTDSQRHRSHQSGRESARPTRELTFFNVTDPAQSRSQETRKLVRTQVMRNFAKEKKRQKSERDHLPGEQALFPTSADSIRSVQQLFSQASIGTTSVTQSITPMTAPEPMSVASSLQGGSIAQGQALDPLQVPMPPNTMVSTSRPDAPLGLAIPQWPLEVEQSAVDLIRHCYSPSFRATNPLYMISVLVQRPAASDFPFSLDLDSEETGPRGQSASYRYENEIFQLAEQFPALAHAICMISASDLALRQINKPFNDHQIIFHRSKALLLLNRAIANLQESQWLATLATIAVLASHELIVGDYKAWTVHVLGFSRILDMRGGLSALPHDSLIRKLLLWSDQIGALFMSMRPFFPQTDVLSSSSRAKQKIKPSVVSRYKLQEVPSRAFEGLLQDESISHALFETIEDISYVARIGQNILDAIAPSTKSSVVEIRDSILQRLLYLAPLTPETEEVPPSECLRLALLLLTIDRLLSRVLPSAYFQITHMVADKLAAELESQSMDEEWSGHELIALWICFIGVTVSSNNPRSRAIFIAAAAEVAEPMFDSRNDTINRIRRGLSEVLGGSQLYEDAEVLAFVSDVQAARAAVEED